MRVDGPAARLRLQRLNMAILAAFLAVAVAVAYWSVGRADGLTARPDNPRLVEAALRLQRGRILDTNNVVLAESAGPPERLQRVYLSPAVGPVVGYYSFRHGTAGIEQGYDPVLRGDSGNFWENASRLTLNQPQRGRDVRLTLDIGWQGAADALLGDKAGAVVLLSLPDAAVRAMASQPSFDPSTLDANFEALVSDAGAPLLNRATQGRYQPGMALQPFLLAAAVDLNALALSDPVASPDRPIIYGRTALRCAATPPEPAFWTDVLAQACPAPMLSLARLLGADGLGRVFEAFGLTRAPALPIAVAAPVTGLVEDAALAAIGQDRLTVTPLQMVLALAALASEGRAPAPRLVTSFQDEAGRWQPAAAEEAAEAAVSAAAAQAVLNALPVREGISELATLALAGPAGTTNAWYLGLAPAGAPLYVVVVVVERAQEPFEAAQRGRALLRTVLAPTD